MNTLKTELIYKLSFLITQEKFEQNDIILVTPAGVISGKPIFNTCSSSFVNDFIQSVRNKYLVSKSQNEGILLDNNDEFILLENATLVCGTTKSFFKTLTVFLDQVTAISLGQTGDVPD